MTFEEAINQAPNILPGHKKEFSECIRNFPFGVEKWLYLNSVVNDNALYQGDIILDLPTSMIDDEGYPVKGSDNVALISNSCDMQPDRHDSIIVSPIIDLNEYKSCLEKIAPEKAENQISAIRKNEKICYFYLPEVKGFPESFIDLTNMISISSKYLNMIKNSKTEKCFISLSDNGFYLFLIKLVYHFARLEKEPKR